MSFPHLNLLVFLNFCSLVIEIFQVSFQFLSAAEYILKRNNSRGNKSGLIQVGHKLLNKLNKTGPAAPLLKLLKFASKPEQLGL